MQKQPEQFSEGTNRFDKRSDQYSFIPQVDWLEASLEIAPEEEKGRIGRQLEKAVMEHDRLLLAGGLGQTTEDAPDGLPEVPVFTRYKELHHKCLLSLDRTCQAGTNTWRHLRCVRGEPSAAEGRGIITEEGRRLEV